MLGAKSRSPSENDAVECTTNFRKWYYIAAGTYAAPGLITKERYIVAARVVVE